MRHNTIKSFRDTLKRDHLVISIYLDVIALSSKQQKERYLSTSHAYPFLRPPSTRVELTQTTDTLWTALHFPRPLLVVTGQC